MSFIVIFKLYLNCKTEIASEKVMLTIWWSQAGLIHHTFLKLSKTITAEIYVCKIDEMHNKTSAYVASFSLQEEPNTSTRQRLTARLKSDPQKLNNLGCKTLPHLHYLPDFASTNFNFFKHLSNFLHKKYFKNQNDI